MQAGERERDSQSDSLLREIVNIIASKCVNPMTRTPYPPVIVEKALASIHFTPNPKKSAKQQALECIKRLSATKDFPITRARIRLSIELPEARLDDVLNSLISCIEGEEQVDDQKYRIKVLTEPMNYKQIIDHVRQLNGTVHIESLREVQEQDVNYL